jgi:hypothetical protein
MNDYLFDKHIIILLLIVKPTFKDELDAIEKQASDKQKQVRRNLYLKTYHNLQFGRSWVRILSHPKHIITRYILSKNDC